MLKFHIALREHKLLDAEHTELVTTGKFEVGGPIGKYAYGFSDKIVGGKHLVGHNGGFPGSRRKFRDVSGARLHRGVLMNSDPPAMMPVIMKLRELLPAG